jgi:hypothetical protein
VRWQLLGAFLAGDAARSFGQGLQAQGRYRGTAVSALAISAKFKTLQGGRNFAQLARFAFIKGEFHIPLTGNLCRRILGMCEVLLGHVRAVAHSPALGGYLGKECGALAE